MYQLSIDTSARVCASAIFDLDSGKILAEKTQDIGRGHAEVLMGLIDECLQESRLSYEDLGRLAVTIGPGSFTGVRVGMSVARGMALGLSLPLVGVSTLDACLALATEKKFEGPAAAILDARRDQAYCKIGNEEPFIAHYAELIEKFETFDGVLCGSGVPVLAEHLTHECLVAHTEEVAPISTISKFAATLLASEDPVEPLYLRSADAKKQAASNLVKEAG